MTLLTVSSDTRITGASSRVIKKLQERLTFRNPKHEENERKGFSNWNIPRELCYLEQDTGSLAFPRGFTRQAFAIIRNSGQQVRLQDDRRLLPPVDFTFSGELRDYQQDALREVLKHDFGTVAIPTGGGKTVLALAAIAERKQPALIIVHSKALQDQWVKRIETFLGIPRAEVGVIGGGKVNVAERITVALVQSLYQRAGEVAPHIGHLIVDECHRAPSRIFTGAVTAFDCRYMLGLSATPFRRDGLGRLIHWCIGDRAYSIERQDLIESGDILPAEVITRQTAFQPTVDPSEQYSTMLTELCEDTGRNMLIAEDVAEEASNGGGVCLVLSDRKSHCETLRDMLSTKGITASVFTGDLKDKERRQVVSDISAGRAKVIVATGQLIGEGFDSKELSTLFWRHRSSSRDGSFSALDGCSDQHRGKEKAVVYDYVDPVGVLECAARERLRVYAKAA